MPVDAMNLIDVSARAGFEPGAATSAHAEGGPRDVLVVDMDHTLLATDMTLENVLAYLGKRPLGIFRLIGWALKGRAVMKARLAEAVMPGVALAPVNPEVLALVQERREAGAHTVLASASNERVVAAVAERFGVFDTVMGASETNNFKGSAKADALDAAFGAGGYTYVGDSPSDLKVWSRAGAVVTAGAPKGLREEAEKLGRPTTHLTLASRDPGTQAKALFKAIRPHQWSKNVLIFVPLLAAQAFSLPVLTHALIAFVVFSLTASSVYVLNDLLDLDADRAHPRKRKRPFASGLVPIKDGFWLAPLLLILAIGLAVAFLPVPFLVVLGVYYLATLSYSFWLKQKIMVDVFLLAGLYTIRIVAGGAATLIPMSPWLIGFSIFFFLALAIVKRLAELIDMVRADKPRSSKRDYSAQDLGMVQALGAAAGFASILVLNFYFTSPEATRFYAAPEYLWAISPLLLFWMSRMLVLANRGEVDDDPIVFSARDRTSRLAGLCVLAIVLCAEFLPWPL